MEISYNGYPVYKGLQKPIEFMGIRGKFLIYAAATFGAAFLLFMAVASIINQVIGILAMAVVSGIGLGFIKIKQKDGLHSKQRYRGIVVYKNLFIKEY